MNRTITTSAAQKCFAGYNIYHSWEGEGGTVTIDMFRSDKFHGSIDEGYRPSSVSVNGKMVWEFKTSGIRPFADLVWLDGEDYPIIIGLNSKYLLSVLPTQDFEVAQMVNAAGTMKMVGGSSVERLLDLKIAVAAGLNLEPDFSKTEQVIIAKRREEARVARLTQKAQQEQDVDIKKAKRLAARAAFAHELKSRRIVTAYTANGEIRKGTPVIKAEMPRLAGDRYYIFMDEHGNPFQCFFLTADRQMHGVSEVSATKPEQKTVLQPSYAVEADCTILIKFEGVATEVPLYKSAADVAIARKIWNTPIMVAFREQSQGKPTGRYCVVRASNKECTDVMVMKPFQKAVAA